MSLVIEGARVTAAVFSKDVGIGSLGDDFVGQEPIRRIISFAVMGTNSEKEEVAVDFSGDHAGAVASRLDWIEVIFIAK